MTAAATPGLPSPASRSMAIGSSPNALAAITAQIIKGGGAMGEAMRALDWERTSLGPPSQWPQSLRTSLGILLASRFPMYIAWGREFIQFYNDDYRPILGASKHPAALGLSTKATFKEIWHIIGPMFEGVMQGEAVGVTDFLLPLERFGFTEECYFIFSYSPIPDESQRVGGVLVTVTETTKRVLGERRMKTLHDLAKGFTELTSSDTACEIATRVFSQNPQDLPFALVYLADADGRHASLRASSGIDADAAQPHSTIVFRSDVSCPFAAVMTARESVELTDLRACLGIAPPGPWPEPPTRALLVRIAKPGQSLPYGFVVCGLGSRLALDADYRHFLELAASEIGTAIATGRAFEEEKRRARELAELDRAKTAFFSNVSHEFRTPLTLLLGPLEQTLADGDDRFTPVQRERLEIAHRNAQRLLRLVNTLLDFSRIESGRVQADYRRTDIGRLTADLASAFRSVFANAGIGFEVDCQALSGEVYIDHDMWEKIVFNLLSNAFKFTLEGSVRLRLVQSGSHLEMTVRDTGTGVATEELERIFDRFHRVPNPRARTQEGSGIGLSLVRDLVALHQGTVGVTSDVGKGTCFTVRIPLGKDHLPAKRLEATTPGTGTTFGPSPFVEEASRWQGATSAVPQRTGDASSGVQVGSEVILLVDDNADMRAYVERLLSPHWHVVAAADGAAALALTNQTLPDLVISDIMMPGLDGMGLLKALRGNPETRQIPVILLSARAGEESSVDGMLAGADDYLIKPFSSRELLARVGAHLAAARVRKDALRTEQKAREELARSNSELEQFASVASHDLQEPLRMVTSYLALIERRYEGALDERGREFMGHAVEGAQRMQRLIASLLDYAKVGRTGGHFKAVSMERVVRDARDNLEEMIAASGALISSEGLPEVQGDMVLLTQLMQNLIGNAIKYRGPQAPTIRISAQRTDDEFVFSVTDNGVGIDARDQSRMFHAFNRVTKDASIPGTGLGLATCKRILDRHGGRIWVDSQPGRGSTFHFSLRPVGAIAARGAPVSAAVDADPIGSNEHFRMMFMQAPASIAIFRGPEHVYEFANPLYLKMLGRTSLVGQSVREALPEIKDSGIYEVLDAVYRSGDPYVAQEYPVPIRFEPDAEPRLCFFSFNLYPLRDRNGSIYGQIVVAVDITQQVHSRRRVETLASDLLAQKTALADSENRFRQLANAMPQIVWMARPDGYLDYFNDRWYEITGASRDLGGDASWKPLVHPDDAERTRSRWYESVESGEPYEIESRLFDRRSGEYRWYLGRALPVRDGDGRIVRWFGTRTDIHEYRMTVEALRRSEQQLERHAIELERSNAELEQFAYVAAHDLQEPIRMIVSYMQLLERRQRPHLDDESKRYISMVSDNATHMEAMVRSVLEYSRIGKGAGEPVAVDTVSAVRVALTGLAEMIAQTKAVIEIGDLDPIHGQPTEISRLFQNLIANAITFRSTEAPLIRISSRLEGGRVIISVRDNGIGIDAQDGERLFTLFQRLHSRGRYPGTGIGLASCKKIVTNHSGRIWFESRPGEGATFHVDLPAAPHA